jgi:hypothetical protein
MECEAIQAIISFRIFSDVHAKSSVKVMNTTSYMLKKV